MHAKKKEKFWNFGASQSLSPSITSNLRVMRFYKNNIHRHAYQDHSSRWIFQTAIKTFGCLIYLVHARKVIVNTHRAFKETANMP